MTVTVSRVLPILNLFGCVAITGIIFTQWVMELGMREKLRGANTELATLRGQLSDEKKRSLGLEADVVQLKESIESLVRTRKEAEQAMANLITEHETKVAAASASSQANLDQAKTWEEALASRDAKIKELNASLIATRARLDEAIAKLKEAGAR